ncbi:MAG: OmpA family protein, partial [Dysgonamonadaceae bacterium]|nr:OmpA family protein [Dysgonamonadaceae bacterium]
PGNNWFFSLEGGLAELFSENFSQIDLKDNLKPVGGFTLGKWLNPVLGIRLSASTAKLSSYLGQKGMFYLGTNHPYPQGGNESQAYYRSDGDDFFKNLFFNDGKPYKGGYLGDFTYGAASIDLLVNLKNLFSPYNPNTFFNPVIYGGIGYAHTFKDGERTAVNSIMEKFGLQLNFRLTKQLDIYLAGETMLVPEIFDRQVGGPRTQDLVISEKIGLTYHFCFNNFIKAPLGSQTVVEVQDQSQINALNNKINDLKARLAESLATPPAPAPDVIKPVEDLYPVFFELDKDVVRDSELSKIEKAVDYLKNRSDAKLILAGFADAKTGNPLYNFTLSKNRVNAVANILIKKYGVDKNRLILLPGGDTTQPFKVNEQNRVVLFFR